MAFVLGLFVYIFIPDSLGQTNATAINQEQLISQMQHWDATDKMEREDVFDQILAKTKLDRFFIKNVLIMPGATNPDDPYTIVLIALHNYILDNSSSNFEKIFANQDFMQLKLSLIAINYLRLEQLYKYVLTIDSSKFTFKDLPDSSSEGDVLDIYIGEIRSKINTSNITQN